MAKDKGQKRREREKKLKQDRIHQEKKNSEEAGSKRGSSLKLYLIIIMVCLAGYFIFYNMR